MSEDNPSQFESNRVIRVLTGKQQKFTIRIHRPDGNIVEFQSDGVAKIDWNSDARALWITAGDYPATYPVIQYEVGMFILCEENPKP